jgi:hypothetical protein
VRASRPVLHRRADGNLPSAMRRRVTPPAAPHVPRLQHQPLAEALRTAQRTLPAASSFLYCCNLVDELSCPPGAGAAAPLSLTDRIQAEFLLLRLLAGGASASPDAQEGISPFAPALLSLFEQRGAAADAAELHSRVERLWLATLLCSPDDVVEAVVSGAGALFSGGTNFRNPRTVSCQSNHAHFAVHARRLQWSPRSAQEVATTLAPRASAGDVDGGTLARLAALRSSWDLRLPSQELLTAPPSAFGRLGRAAFAGVPAGAEGDGARVAPLPLAELDSFPLCGGDVLAGVPVATVRRLSAKLVASGDLTTAPESWLPLLAAASGASSHADAVHAGTRHAPCRVPACVSGATDPCLSPASTTEVGTWPTELLPRVPVPSSTQALPFAGAGGTEESAGSLRACALLDRAMVSTLSTEAAAELAALLRAAPKLVLRSNLSPLVLAGLVEHNHSIAALCVRCLAANAPPALVARYVALLPVAYSTEIRVWLSRQCERGASAPQPALLVWCALDECAGIGACLYS